MSLEASALTTMPSLLPSSFGWLTAFSVPFVIHVSDYFSLEQRRATIYLSIFTYPLLLTSYQTDSPYGRAPSVEL